MCFFYKTILIVDGRVHLCVQLTVFFQSLKFIGNFTGLCKPEVWEHCCITWGGTKSPKSKAYESSLAFPPSSSLHPRHIQTLSKSCQFNLLNISGICTLLSVLAANPQDRPSLFFCSKSPYWSSGHYPLLFMPIRMSYLKNQKQISIFHGIKVPYGIQGFSPVGLLAVLCSHFLSVVSALYLSLSWVT